MAKKTTLTINQADELEEMLGDAANPGNCFGDPRRDIKDLLREVACPKDVVAGLIRSVESIQEDIRVLEQDMNRGNAETVVEGYQRLDQYLGKRFNVTGMRKKIYYWSVGS